MLFNRKAEEDLVDIITPGKLRDQRPYGSSPVPSAPSPLPARRAGNAPTRSVIDSWLVINGNLQSEGEVQVDGQIHGDIRCAHLTVGEAATIVGNITAEDVVVRGTVRGMIRATRVAIQGTAKVDSEIIHKSLSVEQGAVFEGQSHRVEEPMKDVSSEELHGSGKRNGKTGFTAEPVAA